MNGNHKPHPMIYTGSEVIGIEVTTQCNLSCPHCFVQKGNPSPISLPIGMVTDIIEEGAVLGYRNLHLTGGEPLLWPGVFEVIDRAFQMGYRHVFINTNGTLLSRSICRRLSTYAGLSISVSLEVTEAIHEKIRGQNSYERAIGGIRNVLDANIPLIVFSVMCRSALPKLPAFADDLFRGFPAVTSLTFIQLCSFSDDIFPLTDELLEPGDYVRFVKTISLLNVLGLKVHVLNDPLVHVVATHFHMPWIPTVRPLIHAGSLMIGANGAVGLYHGHLGVLGTYTAGALGKILSDRAYQMATAPDDISCPSCRYLSICRDHGVLRPSPCTGNSPGRSIFCKGVMDEINL